MWGGATPYPITVDVPGPVVDAYLSWIGTEDVGSPNSPNTSVLNVNGADVIGAVDRSDQRRDRVTPCGTCGAPTSGQRPEPVKQGANKYTCRGWSLISDGPTAKRRQCRRGVQHGRVRKAEPGRPDGQHRLVLGAQTRHDRRSWSFTFPPARRRSRRHRWLHHARHRACCHQRSPRTCRGQLAGRRSARAPVAGMNLWAKSRDGRAAAHARRVLQHAADLRCTAASWSSRIRSLASTCNETTWTLPVTSLTGWVDGQGWTQDVGGYIAPEWSIVKVHVPRPRGRDLSWRSSSSLRRLVRPTFSRPARAARGLPRPSCRSKTCKLRIAKTDGVTTAKPGDTLTYTIDYENYGPAPAGQHDHRRHAACRRHVRERLERRHGERGRQDGDLGCRHCDARRQGRR